jgi:hypothetical protein
MKFKLYPILKIFSIPCRHPSWQPGAGHHPLSKKLSPHKGWRRVFFFEKKKSTFPHASGGKVGDQPD